MNKKEVAEIKKNFTDSSGFFTLNHVVSAYIDPQKNIRWNQNKLYSLIEEDAGAVMMESLKKVLGGSVGKNTGDEALESGQSCTSGSDAKGKGNGEIAKPDGDAIPHALQEDCAVFLLCFFHFSLPVFYL